MGYSERWLWGMDSWFFVVPLPLPCDQKMAPKRLLSDKISIYLRAALGRQTSSQGRTRFRMMRAQFWTLAQSKHILEGIQVDPLRIESGPSWRVCFFGPFILSDVLKLCKLLGSVLVCFQVTQKLAPCTWLS